MQPCSRHCASNIGDLFGMRMYSTSWGTISASQRPLTKEEMREVSMAGGTRWTKPDCSSDDGGALGVVGMNAVRVAMPTHRVFPPSPVCPGHRATQSCAASSDPTPMRRITLKRYLAALAALLIAPLASASTPVNINTADASTLAKSLDGVGLAKA